MLATRATSKGIEAATKLSMLLIRLASISAFPLAETHFQIRL